jgi:hypothetical protein
MKTPVSTLVRTARRYSGRPGSITVMEAGRSVTVSTVS